MVIGVLDVNRSKEKGYGTIVKEGFCDEVSSLMIIGHCKVAFGGKRAFITGVVDDNGYGWAIAKSLAAAGAEILLPDGSLMEINKVYPLDAVFDNPEDVPKDVIEKLFVTIVDMKYGQICGVLVNGEPLEGKIITKFSSPISHHGIRLTVSGSVNSQVRGGSAGVIESLYGVVRPISIVNKSAEVKSSGKIGSGTTEIPFSIILRKPGEDNLERFYETFHGANISIQIY
ncbi:hypothetical protein L1049_027239 [Liquidambar formosana]|uniref:Uncharacterized protein n=1 Tax=Liquidambar formosana TaxID=63359 RepID=A0AAP0R2H8_LIQFO